MFCGSAWGFLTLDSKANIVDDNPHPGLCLHALPAMSPLGRTIWKIEPCGIAADAHRRPPWASMMDRQMESPIPIPRDLVVKKTSKILPCSLDQCCRILHFD
jgi:hypothetical protein